MMSNTRNPQQVIDYILNVRKAGICTDAEIATQVNAGFADILDRQHSAQSVRGIWRRHNHTLESTENIKTVPTIRRKKYLENVNLTLDGNIMIIPDQHIPFIVDGAIEFLESVYKKYNIDHVLCIGDVLDFYALSFWDKDPDGADVYNEMLKSTDQLLALVDLFPKMHITIGNHDERPYRSARKNGVPDFMMRDYNEIIEKVTDYKADFSNWYWNFSYIINGTILAEHGTKSGLKATYDRAKVVNMNVIHGHTHSYAGVLYINDGINPQRWALNVGALINASEYAFRYGKRIEMKPTLGCAVIVDDVPQVIPFKKPNFSILSSFYPT